LDTVAICPNQLGQIGALWGMQNLAAWVATERLEILSRRKAMVDGFKTLPDWKLLGCGAYFAYVEHPYALPSDQLAKTLVRKASLLTLPGTMFQPTGSSIGKRQLRIAFANIGSTEITEFFNRLKSLNL
jgi:aspartate/methionine/tyrosine aminotransferase